MVGLHELELTVTCKVRGEEGCGVLDAGVILGVETEITRQEIGVSVPIDIPGADAGPPAGVGFEARCRSVLYETIRSVPEDAHRTPLGCEGKIRSRIVVESEPRSPGNHP